MQGPSRFIVHPQVEGDELARARPSSVESPGFKVLFRGRGTRLRMSYGEASENDEQEEEAG